MDPRLDFFLSRVSHRFQRHRLAWLLTAAWSLAAIALLVMLGFYPRVLGQSLQSWLIILGVGLGLAGIAWGISRGLYRDRKWLALQIEAKYPNLEQRLLTAVGLRSSDASVFLRRALTNETVKHAVANNWDEVVSKRSMNLAWGAQFAALFLVAGCLFMLISPSTAKDGRRFGAFAPPHRGSTMEVQPGNAEVERGTNCLITVRFDGELPADVSLLSASEGEAAATQNLQRSLKDPIFAGYLTNLQRDTTYQIESEHGASERFQLRVFDYPALMKSDAELVPPAYARQPNKTVRDTRRVTIPEGTALTWHCHVNKPLAEVMLIDEEGESIILEKDTDDELLYRGRVVVSKNTRWRVHLVDAEGRQAKVEETLTATIQVNRPPEIKNDKVADVTVSPLEELMIQAKVRDDFGLVRAGIRYSLANAPFQEIVLFDGADGKKLEADSAKHQLDFEAMNSAPDQLLSYHFWAEDLDRENGVRRTTGEMYFAEVRPFDEIFRQGQSPSSPSPSSPSNSPQAQQAGQLAELQKKILSSIWNIARSQTGAELSEQAIKDIPVVIESQTQAVELAAELEEKVRDDQSRAYLEIVFDKMQETIDRLTDAKDSKQTERMHDAWASAQSVSEALLKLRAREHEIVRSQQKSSSRSSGASQQNRQRQIDQLKLDDDQERYETEQQASDEEATEDREMRQVMNRLDELARRQQDMNRQLKDLETALQEASTPEAKKELEDQLKRLREQQEELLRDADELLSRMQEQAAESQNQAMQQAQQQVEQAREQVRQSAEAMSQSQPSPSQALSAGSRAERAFSETRDQLRSQSAERFEETMRDMLNKAERLEEQQRALAEKTLDPKGESPSSSSPKERGKEANLSEEENQSSGLRANPDGEPGLEHSSAEQFKKQQAELNELLQRMQETVAEAESSEPLLAEQLYETFRETKQRDLDHQLDLLPLLIERGLESPVREALDEVQEGVSQLKAGIEEAADSVLGSELEGLRRAMTELEQVEQALTKELAANGQAVPPKDGQMAEEVKPSAEARSNPETPNARGSEQASQQASPGQPSERAASENGSEKPPQPGSPSRSEGQSPSARPSPSESSNPNSSSGGAGGTDRDRQARLSDLFENQGGPFTGNQFLEWSDSLREIEESIRDPEMRGRTATIRQAARDLYRDAKRHSKEPKWDLVKELVAKPLAQLHEEIQVELLRKAADRNAVVPIDRDPVPTNYEQRLQRYYENLSVTGQSTTPRP